MTPAQSALGNAPAVHRGKGGQGFDFESFAEFAAVELAAAPLSPVGCCANPDCQQPFAPARAWQVYCCRTCRDADEREFRRIGQKAAPALLAHRRGKYVELVQDDAEALRRLSSAARRYLGRLQTEWVASRRARAAAALHRQHGEGAE